MALSCPENRGYSDSGTGSSHMQLGTVMRSAAVEFESAPVFGLLNRNSKPIRIVRTPSIQKQQKTSSGK